MLEFFRHAQYGAIFLVIAGAFGYWASTSVGTWQRARSTQTARQHEALRNLFYARSVTYGMVVSGLAWWIIEG